MNLIYDYLFLTMWIAWGLYWIISARGVKTPIRSESTLSRWAHYGPLTFAGWLLSDGGRIGWPLRTPFMSRSVTSFWISAAVTAIGLLLTIWARQHLGRNWSGTVTVKEDHTLIRSGPYRLVRHPIYSGMLLALLGTALAIGSARGFIGAGLILFGFLLKLQVEEARMRETFPAEYDDYCRHTARLVPGVF